MNSDNTARILTLPQRRISADHPEKKPFDPKNGHEAILRTIIKKRAEVAMTLNDGTVVYGRVSQFDNYTITIYPDDNDGMPETFFKHAIRSFTQATSSPKSSAE